MRVIVGGILQESNTFSKATSTIEDFRRNYFRIDEQLLAVQAEINELSGFNRAANEQGIELLGTVYTQTVSSGKISRATLNELKTGHSRILISWRLATKRLICYSISCGRSVIRLSDS